MWMLLAIVAVAGTIAQGTLTPDMRRRHALAIRKALDKSYDSYDAACRDMGVHPANFSNELSGERPINFAHLMRLSDEFWRWYPVFLSEAFGMPDGAMSALRLALVARGVKRMAKMTVVVLEPQHRRAK